MRAEYLFISLITLFLGLLLFLTGSFLLTISLSSSLSQHFFSMLKEQTHWVAGFGIGLLLFSSLLLSALYFVSRRRYLVVKMGNVRIRDQVLAEIAKDSLQKLFAYEQIACDVITHRRGKVEIVADLPYISEERQEEHLMEIEKHLTHLFVSRCGIHQEFLFNVSFGKNF